MLTPSRLAAGIRLALLALILFLLAALVPAAPSWQRPVHASARVPSPSLVSLAPPREPPDQAGQPALHPLRKVISFGDATTQFRGAPTTVASSGILVDIDTDQVMWALEPHSRRAPASTTKVISSIVALENFPPDGIVVVQPNAVVDNFVETRMGLHTGERLTIRELLSGMLTVSANDAARAIAGTFGMEQYVEAMNEQVTALGLSDSHFTNPVGYPDDPQMYSSAYDLAALATVAYDNYPLFRALTASHDANLPATVTHQEFKMHNINRLLDIYPPAVGTKSGYTDLAGPCLVAMAVRDNYHLVVVLMNSPKMFDQSKALLEWGFGREGLPQLYPPPPVAARPLVAPARPR